MLSFRFFCLYHQYDFELLPLQPCFLCLKKGLNGKLIVKQNTFVFSLYFSALRFQMEAEKNVAAVAQVMWLNHSFMLLNTLAHEIRVNLTPSLPAPQSFQHVGAANFILKWWCKIWGVKPKGIRSWTIILKSQGKHNQNRSCLAASSSSSRVLVQETYLTQEPAQMVCMLASTWMSHEHINTNIQNGFLYIWCWSKLLLSSKAGKQQEVLILEGCSPLEQTEKAKYLVKEGDHISPLLPHLLKTHIADIFFS